MVRCWKALDLGSLNMQFQQDWLKDEKITALLNFCRKTEKFRSTELYDTPLEGSTSFLYRSLLGHTSMESCRLADLKCAIFSGTGHKTKKLRCSNLFQLTIFKHRLLEGSTILLQYSAITPTPLESSPLSVNWCEVQLFFGAPPQLICRCKALY